MEEKRQAKIQAEIEKQLAIAQKDGLSNEEVLQFVQSLIDTFCTMYNPNATLPPPSVVLSHKQKGHNASYANHQKAANGYGDNGKNYYDDEIQISEEYARQLQQNPSLQTMLKLIESIGHEMQHWMQDCAKAEFNKLSHADQQNYEEGIKRALEEFGGGNKSLLQGAEYQELREALAPYLEEDLIPEAYRGNPAGYFKAINFAGYLNVWYEKEARQSGADFVNTMVSLWKENGKLDEKGIALLDNELKKANDAIDAQKKIDDNYIAHFKEFEDAIKIETENLLKIVEAQEGQGANSTFLRPAAYQYCLNIFLRDKTLEEKRELLKNAMFNGYKAFGKELISSIKADPEYAQHKEEISGEIVGYLKNMSLGDPVNDNEKLKAESYQIDYSSILSKDDCFNIVMALFEKKQFEMAGDLLSKKYEFTSYEQNQIMNAVLKHANSMIEDMQKNPDKYLENEFEDVENCRNLIGYIQGIVKDSSKDRILNLKYEEMNEAGATALLNSMSLEEKLGALENSFIEGEIKDGNLIMNALVNDPKFEENKEDIQLKIRTCLGNASLGEKDSENEDEKLKPEIYTMDFTKILEPEQYMATVVCLTEDGKMELAMPLVEKMGQIEATAEAKDFVMRALEKETLKRKEEIEANLNNIDAYVSDNESYGKASQTLLNYYGSQEPVDEAKVELMRKLVRGFDRIAQNESQSDLEVSDSIESQLN